MQHVDEQTTVKTVSACGF